MMRPMIGENGKLIMTKQCDSPEHATECNKRIVESILFGTTETIGIICEYRNLLRQVDDCNEIFSYEIGGSLSAPPPSVQFDENEVSRYDTTFQPRHVAMLLEKFVQIERLSMVDISSFLFLVEDLIVLSKEASLEKGVYLPDAWMNLKTSHLTKLSNLIMVQRGFINWKNFLIACMNLPYPNQTDILDVLGQFRILDPDVSNCVDKNKFDLVTLWFESVDPVIIAADLTTLRWRECIYQLFSDNFNYFQYVEFLLYFCKDMDPRVGLANSLALLTGHLIPVEELLETDPLGSGDIHVTDSELEMLFSEEDLLIAADVDDESGGSHPIGQKFNLTRRMTVLKERREKLHELEHLEDEVEEELNEELDEDEEPQIPAVPPVTPENEDLSGFPPGPHHTRFGSQSEQKSPRNSLEINSGEITTLGARHLSHGEALELGFEFEGSELGTETEDEFEGEGDEYEHGGKWGGLSEDGRESSPRGDRKSHELPGGSKPEKKRKKNRRTDSVAADKIKREGSKEKPSSGRKKGSKKAKQQEQLLPVDDKTGRQASGSGPLDHSQSIGSDDLTNQILIQNEEEEAEQEEETETEDVPEEETETEVIDPGNQIPLEAFLQSLWFGHITAYPIRNQSFLSTGFEKMKELSASVYEENFMSGGQDVVDPYNASLKGIIKHPFVKEILKRYKGFEILDLTSKLRAVLNMPEDDDDHMSDTESWPDSDSTNSIDLSPLPPSPVLTASSFNDSFSEIFSCMSLQTIPSGASVKSGSIEARRLSQGSALSHLVTRMSEIDEGEERPISHIEDKDSTPEDSESEPEFGDVLDTNNSLVEILSPGLGTPHSFGSKNGSLEDVGSAEDVNARRQSLKRYEDEEYGENDEDNCMCVICNCDPRTEEIEVEIEQPSSSTESLELKLAEKQARCSQSQKSQKYSPMAFGLDPNMGSLLW